MDSRFLCFALSESSSSNHYVDKLDVMIKNVAQSFQSSRQACQRKNLYPLCCPVPPLYLLMLKSCQSISNLIDDEITVASVGMNSLDH